MPPTSSPAANAGEIIDGTTFKVEALIEEPAEIIWGYIADISVPPKFSDELERTEWVEPSDGPALGAKFLGHSQLGDTRWTTTSVITVFQPGHSFGWVVESPDNPVATWRFSLIRDRAGIRLVFYAHLGPGPSGLTAAIEASPSEQSAILERRINTLRDNMQATVDGIKRLAECAT